MRQHHKCNLTYYCIYRLFDLVHNYLIILEGGASFDKCFDTYHGPSGFSEPETAAIRDFILKQ